MLAHAVGDGHGGVHGQHGVAPHQAHGVHDGGPRRLVGHPAVVGGGGHGLLRAGHQPRQALVARACATTSHKPPKQTMSTAGWQAERRTGSDDDEH